MLLSTIVSSEDELQQIYTLNRKYLKQNLSDEEKYTEGFVTCLYSPELLRNMHQLAPSVIVKDGNKVAGYALTTLIESRRFHPDLENMFQQLDHLPYMGKPLSEHNFYCMGQICIDQPYRGMGLVKQLYEKHKNVYGTSFDFLLTEISSNNPRSLKAHCNVGFKTIYTYCDKMDEWKVVVWNWCGM
jgi:hypothetical protein